MKALVHDTYGSPDVLKIEEIEKPEPPEDGALVRVHAASLNRLDWYGVQGKPYLGRATMGLRKPKGRQLGVDFAGTVESVGQKMTRLKPGDEVFGGRSGALAEYVPAAKAVVPKPASMTFEEAATLPVAGVSALQGLRDKARVQPGQHVLINGASGGVGTFAVQIAKALGAEVTAVCSTRNVEQARALGADEIVDYTRDDFTRSGRRYDAILDIAGSRSWRECKRVLKPEGLVVVVGGPSKNPLLGPLGHIGGMLVRSKLGSGTAVFFIADLNNDDLGFLGELVEQGKVRAVVERRYKLEDAAEALAYMGESPQGKLVVTI
jgi:NADPH:quinone reductase-like Zn-dependent oxidoreductase